MMSGKRKAAMMKLDEAVKVFNEAQSEHTDEHDAKMDALEKLRKAENSKGEAWRELCKLIDNGE